MKQIRIIPRLDIKGPNLVKGIHMEGLRVLGRPELFAPKYYADGADELIFIDTVASLYGRNSLHEIVKRTAQSVYIPLTVGGGIRSVEDIRGLLRAGADKVAINTAAVNNPSLISEAARVFGSQCIVVSIHAKSMGGGQYECLTEYGREKTGLDVFDWARRAEDLGAGEILLSSVDRDGTGKGYDIGLTRRLSESLGIPVIASSGAGKKEDVRDAILEGKADAVAVASMLHYGHVRYMAASGHYEEEGNIEFLSGGLALDGLNRRGINPATIGEIKEFLAASGIACRIVKDVPA